MSAEIDGEKELLCKAVHESALKGENSAVESPASCSGVKYSREG